MSSQRDSSLFQSPLNAQVGFFSRANIHCPNGRRRLQPEDSSPAAASREGMQWMLLIRFTAPASVPRDCQISSTLCLFMACMGEGYEHSENGGIGQGGRQRLRLPQQFLEGTPEEVQLLCSCRACICLYHCSQIYLRNRSLNLVRSRAAQIPAVSGYTLRSHLL